MRQLQRITPMVLVLLVFVSVVTAQEDCPVIVEQALEAAGEACAETGRNQACYGNVDLTAELRADVDVEFDAAGDITDLTNIEGLTLSGLDEEAGTWGVAVLQVQANLPDTLPGQNVTMLLFGDAEITDAATEDEVQEDDFLPMQAFYFRSGIGDAPCAEAPNSGILIQTPEGAGTIELTMNDVNITLGSTAYVQGEADGDMAFFVIEGEGTVEAEDVEQTVPAGTFVTVPLDEDLHADGEPTEPEPYDPDHFNALPLELLPREIEVAEPAGEGTDTAGGGGIAILPGSWTVTVTGMSGCGGIDDSIVANIPVQTLELEGDYVEAMLTSASGTGQFEAEGVVMNISNPEENVIVLEFEAEGAVVTTTYTVISETYMEVHTEITGTDCDVIVDSTMEYAGE